MWHLLKEHRFYKIQISVQKRFLKYIIKQKIFRVFFNTKYSDIFN